MPEYLGKTLNKDLEVSVYFSASLIMFLVSYLLPFIKNEYRRRIFSVVTCTAIMFFVFGMSTFLSICHNLLGYLILAVFKGRQQLYAVYIVSGVFLSTYYWWLLVCYPGYNGIDIQLSLMFNFLKQVALTVCI